MTGVRETEINHGEARRLPDRPTIAMAAEDAIESLYTIVIGQHVEQYRRHLKRGAPLPH